jgi:hypothetical protein
MKIILLAWSCFAAVFIGDAAAQIVSRDSLHLKPIGTAVSSWFVLVNRVVPLTEGEFILVAISLHDARFVRGDFSRQPHKMVEVVLGQMADGKLRVAVGASAVLKYAGTVGWVTEPCKGDQVVLYQLDRVPFMKRNYEQNCLIVNRRAASLGQNSTGVYADLADWVRKQGGTTPIRMVVDATVTRIAVVEYLVVRYAFNPAAFGCGEQDLQSPAFVDGVVEVGKAMQVAINEGFGGRAAPVRSLAETAPQLQQDCGAAPRRAAPAKRGKPGSAAERLKTLEGLKEQGLISPAEYEERRRKILDGL